MRASGIEWEVRGAGKRQPQEFEIRPVRLEEVEAAAKLHFEFFGGPEVERCSFLKLGPEFLQSGFYRLNLDNPYFFVLGAFLEGELIGLQVFTTDRRKMLEHLLRVHRWEFLLQLLQAFARRPISCCRYLVTKLTFGSDLPPEVGKVPAALLLTLVRPEARTKSFLSQTGIWVGGALLEAMEAVMREHGCQEYWSETTVDNGFVRNLSRRVGAICVGEALRQGVRLRFMVAPVRGMSPGRIKSHPQTHRDTESFVPLHLCGSSYADPAASECGEVRP